MPADTQREVRNADGRTGCDSSKLQFARRSENTKWTRVQELATLA